MQQYINNQNREIKLPFRDGERAALSICQALCFYFRRRDRRGCNPCPTKRFKCYNSNCWGINLSKSTLLKLFPIEGKIEVKKNGQLEMWIGISAFSISYDPGVYRVCFYNANRRPILAIDRFGSVSVGI